MLLKLRWTIGISGFRRGQRRVKIRYILLLVFIIVMIGAAVFLTWKFFGFMRSTEILEIMSAQNELQPIFQLLNRLPVLVSTGVFFILLVTSFGVMLQALYLSRDIDFLLVLPVPSKSIFLAKLIQAILPNLSIVFLFALPIMFIFGSIRNFNFVYYPVVVLLLVALALAACGFSSLLVMAVVRVVPARRVAEVLGFLGAILSILCSQSGQLARFESISGDQVNRLLGIAALISTPWSPLSWAGSGLIATGQGEWLVGSGLLTVIFGLSALIFITSMIASERLYYSGWASLQGVSSRKKEKKREKRTKTQPSVSPITTTTLAIQARWIDRIIPPAVQAMVLKDSLVLRRDLRNLSQLVTPLIIGVIYTLLLFRGGENPFQGGSGNAPELVQEGLRSLSIFGNVFISLFVSWSILSRLAGMGFSMEGKQYWVLKSSPVKTGTMIVAKFIVAYLPTLALSSLFLTIISVMRAGSLRLLPYTLPAIAFIIAGNCGLNLAFGIAGARLDWEDPRQMQRFWSGCLGAIATFIYLPINLLLFFGPAVVLPYLGLSEPMGYLTGLVFGSAFSLLVAILPLMIAKNRVGALGDT